MQPFLTRIIDPIARLIDVCWDPVIWFVLHRYTRAVVAWALALAAADHALHRAWHSYDKPERNDGNNGHTHIDFGGQYLMGRMLVTGNGQHLYDRNVQREVLQAAYQKEDEVPNTPEDEHDAKKLMGWVMGNDNHERMLFGLLAPVGGGYPLNVAVAAAAGGHHDGPEVALSRYEVAKVGGPLYPPVNAFFYAPLAVRGPQIGYRINVVLNLVWAFVAAWGVSYWTRHQVWASLAVPVILVYPGFTGSIVLGQNATLTLCIVVWGWALQARGHPVWGGIFWGLLAFKPVWAAAFFLIPLITYRWRTCAAMLFTGVTLAGLTLPFVGLHSWRNWLLVGRMATEIYRIDHNWIFLSRDLLSVPRRFLNDFSRKYEEHGTPEAEICGWVLFLSCLSLTLFLPLWRRRQAKAFSGAPAVFLLLGAWMACFHFMYYDALVSAVAIAALFAEPRRLIEPIALTPVHVPPRGVKLDQQNGARPGDPDWYPPPVPVLGKGWRSLIVLILAVPTLLCLALVPLYFIPELSVQLKLRYGEPKEESKEENTLTESTRLFAAPSFEQDLALAGATLVLSSFLGALYVWRKELRLPYYLAQIPPPAAPDAPDLLAYHRAALPMHYPVRLSFGGRKYRGFWVVNRAAPYALLLLLFIENYLEQFKLMGSFLDSEGKRVLKVVGFIGGEEAQPHDTYFLMALWVWCGIVWACTPRGSKQISNAWGVGPAPEVVELPADVGGGHQGFAHQYGADAGRPQA